MNHEFDTSGEGLLVTGRALKPYGGSLYGLPAVTTALFNKFRQRNVILTGILLAMAVTLLVATILVFSGAMDPSRATDPVNTAAQLYF